MIVLLIVGFFAVGFISRKSPDEEKTRKATKPLSLIINLSPLVGIVVFAILFSCVLKGQLMERVAHAISVFVIWMCATQYYCYLLAHFKNKWILVSCIIGMIYSIGVAIFLTPLDRYISAVYSFAKEYSLLLGCGILVVFYAITIMTAICKNKLKGSKADD